MKLSEILLARRRLAKTLKPNPGLRAKRLAQMSPERRTRAERNAREISAQLGIES